MPSAAVRQLILLLLLIVAIGGYVAVQSARLHSAEKRAAEASAEAAALRIDLVTARATTRVVTRYVDRVQIVRERAATITKEVPVYVTAEADALCVVPVGFVRLHDAAAENRDPEPAGNPDAAAEGVELSTVTETVTGNYAICHETAEQVIALQDYVRVLLNHISAQGGGRPDD